MLSHQRNTKRNIQYDTNSNVQVTPGSNTGHANTSHQSAYAGRFISANVDVCGNVQTRMHVANSMLTRLIMYYCV